MITTNSYSKVDLESLEPLTPKTEDTLKKYVFKSTELEGGCGELQSFAQRVSTLKTLENKLSKGEIDLGCKDRVIAVAKCVGAALLTAAFFIVWAAPFILCPPITAGWPALSGIFGGSGLAFSGAFFYFTCIEASEVFQRPSPKQLREELNEKRNTTLPEQDLRELTNVLTTLSDKQAQCEKETAKAQEIGGDSRLAKLSAKRNAILAAHADVSKMLAALTNTIAE